jgi:hypothetical protein
LITAVPDTDDEAKLRLAVLSSEPDTASWLRGTKQP